MEDACGTFITIDVEASEKNNYFLSLKSTLW